VREIHKRFYNLKMMMGFDNNDERALYYKGKHEAFTCSFPVSAEQYEVISRCMKEDCAYLAKAGLMDYSLIIGVMRLKKEDAGDLLAPGACSQYQPFICEHRGTCYAYYMGIIDFLQEWTTGKKIAHVIKKSFAPHPIATIDPAKYADQFLKCFIGPQGKFQAAPGSRSVSIDVGDLTEDLYEWDSADDADFMSDIGDMEWDMDLADYMADAKSAHPRIAIPSSTGSGVPSPAKSPDRPRLFRDENSHHFAGSLQDRFIAACDFSDHWQRGMQLSMEEKILAFRYYQQATFGDINVERPEYVANKPMGAQMWDAWKSMEGTPRDEAMQKYVETVEQQRSRHESAGSFQGKTIEERFIAAKAFRDGWPNGHSVSIEEMVLTWAYAKQADEGDVTIEAHEMVEHLNYEKHEAWKKLHGMSREMAMVYYIDEIERQRARYGDRPATSL